MLKDSLVLKMGLKQSKLSEEQLNEYSLLTYLSRIEINLIYERFYRLIDESKLPQDINTRFSGNNFFELCPELKYNPFRHQIIKIFSSKKDGSFSFDDLLNFYSVFSILCPLEVKITWIFKIFDIDNDGLISKCDLSGIMDLLTAPHKLLTHEKEYFISTILREIDFHGKGGINTSEFINLISKTTDFKEVFSIRI